jgi:hypothetical protein
MVDEHLAQSVLFWCIIKGTGNTAVLVHNKGLSPDRPSAHRPSFPEDTSLIGAVINYDPI